VEPQFYYSSTWSKSQYELRRIYLHKKVLFSEEKFEFPVAKSDEMWYSNYNQNQTL